MAVAPSETTALEEFFDYIYGNEDGFAYLAFKHPGNHTQFVQKFFEWPFQKVELFKEVLERRSDWEVYFAPALFSSPEAKKQNVKGARVFWCEFDGATPTELSGLPQPTLRVQSSSEGHEHWYWRVDQLVDAHGLEQVNRSLTYMLGADVSGWDATQILRPPLTLNHKREATVKVLLMEDDYRPPDAFAGLPQPPPLVEVQEPESLPDVVDVVARANFAGFPAAWKLFRQGAPEGQRSTALMSLGYYLAEMQLTNEQMLALLLNADERWGKFKGRQDRIKRLLEIVTRAKKKYPIKAKAAKDEQETVIPLVSMGLKTLMATEVNLEWIWDGFLQKGGYFLLTGPSGVGKTQFSMNAAAHFALGRDFLDRNVEGPLKIGIFSLEMGLVDLKHFLASQVVGYSEEELEILEKQLRFYPLGEPIYLNRDNEKRRVEDTISSEGLDGILIDSLGSTTEGELGDEKDTKNLMDWNDSLRQRFGVFTWYVHHHRKAQSDNKRPNKLADVYGSQYITARATSVAALWSTTEHSALDFLPLKIRLAEKPDPFRVYRDGQLRFTRKVSGITVVEESKTNETPKESSDEVVLGTTEPPPSQKVIGSSDSSTANPSIDF